MVNKCMVYVAVEVYGDPAIILQEIIVLKKVGGRGVISRISPLYVKRDKDGKETNVKVKKGDSSWGDIGDVEVETEEYSYEEAERRMRSEVLVRSL